MSDATADFLAGIPVAVDPQRIERELARLWKPASDAEGGEGAVLRACVANVVVFVMEERALDHASAVLEDVSREHPNRSLFLVVEPPRQGAGPAHGLETAETAGLRATVSALCHSAAPGVAPVCCERIRLVAREEHAELFVGAVAPLLVPDISACLWWTADLRHPLLPRLAAHADKLIVDCRGRPEAMPLVAIRKLLDREECQTLVDLGWRSTEVWRRAVADLFDDPAARALLPRLARVELGWTATEGRREIPATAWLLAGWIASRLRWKPEDAEGNGGERRVRCSETAGAARLVTIRRRQDSGPSRLPPGTPVTLRFLGAAGQAAGYVSIEMDPEIPETARIAYETPQLCLLPRVAPFRRPSDAELVGEAIEAPACQSVFRESLGVALEMARRA